jgi:hypothetical protein
MFYSKTFGNEVFQKDAVGALDSPINPVTLQNSSTKFTPTPDEPGLNQTIRMSG